MTDQFPPFSARNRGAHARVDNDCPETARIGLLHLLGQLVDKRYVDDWNIIRSELQRIARVRPGLNRLELDELLLGLPWEKVFDFCERLYSHLATGVSRHDPDGDDTVVITTKTEAQEYVGKELQRLFIEENLAFEFTNGLVRRRGRRHTAEQVARAEQVLGDPRLSSALKHFNKALRYFRNVSQPDPENAVKEAVCAVEAAARALFPNTGATLGDVVKEITGDELGSILGVATL